MIGRLSGCFFISSITRKIHLCPTLALTCCQKRGWVGARRVALRYVSSHPPLSTVRATFIAHGATPLVNLHSQGYEASGSISTAFTDAFLCALSSFASIPSKQGTACAFAGYLVRCLLFGLFFPKARGLRPQFSSWCTRLSRVQTTMPHPTLPEGLGVSLGSPLPTSHSPSHPSCSLPCSV